jgi:glycosyltransferase involved in cell wall biosynthesis
VTFSLSVCICTRNRPEDLEKALRSIAGSSAVVHEVIVSDDSTDERSRELVQTRFPDARWVVGPRIGLGANRNRALDATTGSHVLFIDDDVELGPDFVALMQARWAALPASDRDRAILAGSETNRGHRVTPNEQSFLGFQQRPYRPGEPLRTVVINAAVFPRSMFDAVRFDPQLVYGYDEVDVTTRAIAHGYVIHPSLEIANRHSPSPVNRDYYRPFTDASRLYVTARRRGRTEGRRAAAGLFLVAASAHLAVHAVRRDGIRGLTRAATTLRIAGSYFRSAQKTAV